jgi:hypothetical protein
VHQDVEGSERHGGGTWVAAALPSALLQEVEVTRAIWAEDACLTVDDVRAARQLLYPLFDVRVQTFGEGIVVIGFRINAHHQPIRECRQAWNCVPLPSAT